MNYDQYGQCWTTNEELFEMLYRNPKLELDKFYVKNTSHEPSYNVSVGYLYADFPTLSYLREIDVSVEQFDHEKQECWNMPDSYKKLDIAQWVLNQCKTDAELQRVGQELLLFQERNLFNLLRYLKYFVDTVRENNVVWGLGRGSSVASYVLYLIGVHKINSLYYDLPIEEFLK